MWYLNITPEEYDEIYAGTPAMEVKELFTTYPQSDEELINKFLPSKLWRLNNLYTITNKEGKLIKFKMNRAQHKTYATYLKHPRIIILKSRQQGISTFFLINFFDDAITTPNLEVGLMAQGTDEASKLLERVKTTWDYLPLSIKKFFGLGEDLVKDNRKEVSFANGSTIYIRVSFRSGTLQRLHISEFGKIANKYPERAKETKSGSMQAIKVGLPIIIESTAEGENIFKDMWDTAYENFKLNKGKLSGEDYYPFFLSWVEDPDCWLETPQFIPEFAEQYFKRIENELNIKLKPQQKYFWVAKYRTLGEAIYQEYPATPEDAFRKDLEGAYYNRLFTDYVINRGRIVENLYDPHLPVYTAWDLGMDDETVIVFFQIFNREFRIIDEYRNSGEGLSHYVSVLNEKPYTITKNFLPHDVRVKELTTGLTRLQVLKKLGLKHIYIVPRLKVADGIEIVRQTIPNMWIDKNCSYLKSCFLNYRKEFDDKLNVWKEQPRHDEFSHGADAIRYACVGVYKVFKKPNRKRYRTNVVDGLAL